MSVFRKLFPLCLWITVLASALLCAGVIVGNLRFWALGFCHWLAPVTLAAGLLFLFLVWFYRDRLDALAQGRFPMLAGTVLALCLAVKLTWVLTHPIAPSVDYATFHGLAAKLAESWRIESGSYLDQYIPTFPHIFGYSSFLSLFYILTGPSPMTAAVVNVLLSCLSCMCLLRLGARLHSPLCGLGAGLAWTLLPSQTVYNMFVLSEPWYTFLILLAACCALEFRQFTQLRHNLALAVALGLILALIQASRPVAAIGLILMGICLFFIRCPSCGREALARLGLLANELTSFILGQRIGTDPAQSVGYSLAVGLNEDSGGVWNPSDSEYLTSRMYAGGGL